MCFQPQRQAQQRWQEVSTNIPAFYKSYQDLSSLASVLGASFTYSGSSLDDLKTPGIYTMNSSKLPDQLVGSVEVVVTGERVTQICYQPSEPRILTRAYKGSAWTSWIRVDNFGCATPEALASLLGENWPTIDGNASSDNPFNVGKIFGLLRVTIVNKNTYSDPSYIIVAGQNITELYKGWYIRSLTVNSSEELLVETTTAQHVYVTKIM